MDVKCEPGSIKIDIKMVRIALRQKKKKRKRMRPGAKWLLFLYDWTGDFEPSDQFRDESVREHTISILLPATRDQIDSAENIMWIIKRID